jgi:UV DNA damage endonuclease
MAPKRKRAAPAVDTNPDHNPAIVDGKTALRASPDAEGKGEVMEVEKVVGEVGMVDMDKELEVKPKPRGGRKKAAAKKEVVKTETEVKPEPADSELSELENVVAKDFTDPSEPASKKAKKTPTKASRAAKKGADEIKAFIAEQAKANGTAATPAKKGKGKAAVKSEDPDEAVLTRDPEADEDEGEKEDVETEKKEAARPPPVNSDYLPLPWKGRLGYVRPPLTSSA